MDGAVGETRELVLDFLRLGWALLVTIALVGLNYYFQWRRERRRKALGPYVPLPPGAVPTGAGRGPRFRMIVEVDGYDDRANADLVERDIQRALKSPSSSGVFYDVGSVDVRECRQLPSDVGEESTTEGDSGYRAGHGQPSKTAP